MDNSMSCKWRFVLLALCSHALFVMSQHCLPLAVLYDCQARGWAYVGAELMNESAHVRESAERENQRAPSVWSGDC